MNAKINEGGSKIQLIYVLWVLENFSDENNTLKQDDIVDILKQKGYSTERKSVAKDLDRLYDFGYKIHGIEPELDDDGNEMPLTRGKIWLEKEIKDEQLNWLIDAVKYNVHINNKNKKDLIDKIISIGSKSFKEKYNASAIVDGGNIFEIEGQSIFEQLKIINEACVGKIAYKIKFKYGKMAFKGNKIVYNEEKSFTVSPYWVVVQRGNTYLIGYNHDENKIWHFRVDKMKDVEIIKSYAKPRSDTSLKGVDIGKYVLEHPLMFSGELTNVELKINKNFISDFIEAFGTGFSVVSNDGENMTVRLRCGEPDMFYWAVQLGDSVEVLTPQDLRDRIREHIEGMVFKYQSTDGDKFSEAIRTARRHRVLDLRGIDLTGETKHHTLKNVKSLYLSNNKIDNIDFVKNMPNLTEIRIENNNIADITPLEQLKHLYSVHLVNVPVKSISVLADLPIETLRVDLDEADLSAVTKMKKLRRLSISEKCSLNSFLHWKKLDRNEVRVDIFNKEMEEVSHNQNKKSGINGYYPFNVLKRCFGVDKEVVGDIGEIENEVKKMLDMLTPQEKQCAEYIFKSRFSNEIIGELMGLSANEFYKLERSISEKFYHPYFNKCLEKYVKEENMDENKSFSQEQADLLKKLQKKYDKTEE